MKTRRDYLRLLIFLVTSCLADPALAGQAMQTINIATSAAGQSGYIAALIENKKLDVKYGIKINNMMMDFTEAANAVKLGRTDGELHATEHRGEPGQKRHGHSSDHATDLVRQLLGRAQRCAVQILRRSQRQKDRQLRACHRGLLFLRGHR